MSSFVRSLAAGAVWAAIALAAVIPFLLWGSDKAPEFSGAFMAAIVAAIAVVLGAYYQAELTRRRDDEIARREEIAEATDLFLWLGHTIGEMNFVLQFMRKVHDDLTNGTAAGVALDQYREAVSPPFMEELKDRAKTSARLSPSMGVIVAPVLYDTFLSMDRVYRFRGASLDLKFDAGLVEKHLLVTESRITALERAQAAVGDFLSEKGMPLIAISRD